MRGDGTLLHDITNINNLMIQDVDDNLYKFISPSLKSLIIWCGSKQYQIIKCKLEFKELVQIEKMEFDEVLHGSAYLFMDLLCKHLDGTKEIYKIKPDPVIDILSKTLTFTYNGCTKPPKFWNGDVIEISGIQFRITNDNEMYAIKCEEDECEEQTKKLEREINDMRNELKRLEDERRNKLKRMNKAYNDSKGIFTRLLDKIFISSLLLPYDDEMRAYNIKYEQTTNDINDEMNAKYEEMNSIMNYKNDHFMDNITIEYGISDIIFT
jgi:hypothetical protein